MAVKDEQQPLHILFLPFLVPGHLIPIGDMAALFAARGVKCTILTTPVNAAVIRPAVDRANDAALWSGHPAIDVAVVPFPDVGLPPGIESATALASEEDRGKFFNAIMRMREPFDQFVAEHRPDAVVSDGFYTWSVDAAADHGVPRLVFLGTSAFARSCTDSTVRNNPVGACADEDPDAVVPLPGLPHRVEMRRSQMLDPKKRPDHWAFFQAMNAADQSSYGEVINSFHELEPEYAEHYREALGRRAWLVGPVALASKDVAARGAAPGALSPDADGVLRWLDAKPDGSVAYVSFGTLSSFSPAEMRELARGLDLSGMSFVWVIGGGAANDTDTDASAEWMPEGFADLISPRGDRGFTIRGWAPQMLILNHPAVGVFLTHCGWNSTLEAVSAGVPMVTWPRYADQFYNEKLIVEVLKVGVGVGSREYASNLEDRRVIGGEVIAAAIGTVMGDGKDGEAMRRKARELGVKARGAPEKGGSSYDEVGRLMDALMDRRRPAGSSVHERYGD
uniref:Glycosyltransferase n=1 Tax=Leersia perrieri TaxID=77586 RepID=A0A0D9V2K7_9ORYZ